MRRTNSVPLSEGIQSRHLSRRPATADLCNHDLDLAPRWLNVRVPNGPTFASGLYRLLKSRRYNGYPVWVKPASSANEVDCYIFSTASEHWAIGGCGQDDGVDSHSFTGGHAWVYSPARHFGQAPDQVQRPWQHNQPEWTSDAGIAFAEVGDEDAARLLREANTSAKRRGYSFGFGKVVGRMVAGVGALTSASAGGAHDEVFGEGIAWESTSKGRGDFVCSAF